MLNQLAKQAMRHQCLVTVTTETTMWWTSDGVLVLCCVQYWHCVTHHCHVTCVPLALLHPSHKTANVVNFQFHIIVDSVFDVQWILIKWRCCVSRANYSDNTWCCRQPWRKLKEILRTSYYWAPEGGRHTQYAASYNKLSTVVPPSMSTVKVCTLGQLPVVTIANVRHVYRSQQSQPWLDATSSSGILWPQGSGGGFVGGEFWD